MKKHVLFLVIVLVMHGKSVMPAFWQYRAQVPTSAGYGGMSGGTVFQQEYDKVIDEYPATRHLDFRMLNVLYQNEKMNAAGPYPWPTHPTWVTGDVMINWEIIKRSEYSGNCGYHALFNVMTLLRCLQKLDSDNCPNLLSAQKYVEFMQIAVPEICKYRLSKAMDTSTLDWLDGDEMEKLYRALQQSSTEYIRHPEVPFFVVENVEGIGVCVQLYEAIIRLQSRPTGMMGFVWNYGARTDLGRAGGIHWTAFVAVKHPGGIILNYMNSIPTVMELSQLEFIKSLFQKSPKRLRALIAEQEAKASRADHAHIKSRNAMLSTRPESNNIFQQHLGIVSVEGPFVQAFTPEMLNNAPGLAGMHFNDAAVQSLNTNWRNVVARKKPAVLTRSKERHYGIWLNPVTGALQAYEEDLRVLLMHVNDWLVANQNNDLSFSQPLMSAATLEVSADAASAVSAV